MFVKGQHLKLSDSQPKQKVRLVELSLLIVATILAPVSPQGTQSLSVNGSGCFEFLRRIRSRLEFGRVGGIIGREDGSGGMRFRLWPVFFGVQTAGIVALHLGPDWSMILGVLLLSPGLPAVYLVPSIHRLLLIRDVWLVLAALIINGTAWHGIKLAIRKSRNRC
jgi:hypothetical protein